MFRHRLEPQHVRKSSIATALTNSYTKLKQIPLQCLALFAHQSTGKLLSATTEQISRFRPLSFNSHAFGQPAKKERGILENVKVTNSPWDTNIISASGVRISNPTSFYIHSYRQNRNISLPDDRAFQKHG